MWRDGARAPENVGSQEAKALAWPKAMLARAIRIYGWNGKIPLQNADPDAALGPPVSPMILAAMPLGWGQAFGRCVKRRPKTYRVSTTGGW